MAIDTSIYGQLKPVQIDSPVNALAQVTQLKNAQNKNRLFDMQVADSERARSNENALNEAYRGATNPDGTIDRTKLLSGIAQSGQGSKLPGIQKVFSEQDKSAREAELSSLKAAREKQGIIAQIAGSAIDQASWTNGKAQLQQMGVDVSQIPDQFDPRLAQTLVQRSLTGVQQLDKAFKEKEFAYRQQNDAANRGVTLRGQNMTDSRARELAAATREAGGAGKPPPGYRFTTEGNLEAIPGGPADIKAGELGAKREKSQQAAIAQADRLITKVDQALSKVNWSTAGGPGKVLSGIPGTEAKNLEADLETIKANLGFAELQAMREASPTGGALGAIAVQELTALQSTLSSLDQAQSAPQLKAHLGEVRTHYKNWKDAVTKANSVGNNVRPSGGVIDFGSLK